MSLYSDLNDILTPYAQKIKRLAATDGEIKADLGAYVNDLKNSLAKYNAYDLMVDATRKDGTSSEVTWHWNTDGSVTATGTASAASARALMGSSTEFPRSIEPGDTIYVVHSAVTIKVNFAPYKDGVALPYTNFLSNGEYKVPSDATGLIIKYAVSKNDTVDETANAHLFLAKTNKELTELSTELAERLNSAMLLSTPSTDKAIPQNADLDDYKTDGQYKVVTTAISRTISNIPETSIGQLIVFHLTNDAPSANTIIQAYISKTPKIHLRYYSAVGGFSSWRELATVSTDSDSDYSWKRQGFLLHDPDEEQKAMVDIVSDVLGITISDTSDWLSVDGNEDRVIPAASIYEMWDELQESYPNYIDEGEIIGYSLDPDGENYSPVKAYYIHPRKTYTNWSGNTVNISYQNIPTIYITAGTHGGESTPTWTLYEIFRRAFQTGTIYSDFLEGLQFRVVPVLDVWCYDHKKRYLAAAYNADGTQKVTDSELKLYDANRQCVCSDASNPSYSSLTTPTYATEAKALTKYLNDHNFGSVNGDCYIDLHNCSYALGYLTTDNPTLASAYNIMIDTLAKDWAANTTFANGDAVDYYASSTSDHTRQRGTILASASVESSYGWFFEKAYSSFASNILEVQQTDNNAGNKYAFAKAFDMTYRWLDTLFRRVKSLA